MATYTELLQQRTYGFSVLPELVSIIGNDFNQVLVLGAMTASVAETFADIAATHAKLYPYLPAGAKKDPGYYTYYYVQLQSGIKTVISSAWINWETVTEIQSKTLVVTVENTKGVADIDIIKAMFTANGFTKVTVDIK